jgi:metal-responsive CopG/Arc/MetJ family transcriptional regulator
MLGLTKVYPMTFNIEEREYRMAPKLAKYNIVKLISCQAHDIEMLMAFKNIKELILDCRVSPRIRYGSDMYFDMCFPELKHLTIHRDIAYILSTFNSDTLNQVQSLNLSGCYGISDFPVHLPKMKCLTSINVAGKHDYLHTMLNDIKNDFIEILYMPSCRNYPMDIFRILAEYNHLVSLTMSIYVSEKYEVAIDIIFKGTPQEMKLAFKALDEMRNVHHTPEVDPRTVFYYKEHWTLVDILTYAEEL